jgi:hypothetical protein
MPLAAYLTGISGHLKRAVLCRWIRRSPTPVNGSLSNRHRWALNCYFVCKLVMEWEIQRSGIGSISRRHRRSLIYALIGVNC